MRTSFDELVNKALSFEAEDPELVALLGETPEPIPARTVMRFAGLIASTQVGTMLMSTRKLRIILSSLTKRPVRMSLGSCKLSTPPALGQFRLQTLTRLQFLRL